MVVTRLVAAIFFCAAAAGASPKESFETVIPVTSCAQGAFREIRLYPMRLTPPEGSALETHACSMKAVSRVPGLKLLTLKLSISCSWLALLVMEDCFCSRQRRSASLSV
jgi:hypothetical protein